MVAATSSRPSAGQTKTSLSHLGWTRWWWLPAALQRSSPAQRVQSRQTQFGHHHMRPQPGRNDAIEMLHAHAPSSSRRVDEPFFLRPRPALLFLKLKGAEAVSSKRT